MLGKIRLACTPWLNHSWHVPLYLTSQGLTTGLIARQDCAFELHLDCLAHVIRGQADNGRAFQIGLVGQSIAEVYAALLLSLSELGITVVINEVPNEVMEPIPFSQDTQPRDYDPDYVNSLWRALVEIHRVFSLFRTGYLGKSSPVHFFWGSFDLAVTRFSGLAAPLHPGGVPNLPDAVTREAYSHEVSSAGFWPGGGGIDEPAFYSYAYPTPDGFAQSTVSPADAYFDSALGEFVLPYSAVAKSQDPDGELMAFLSSTYEAAANTGNWERSSLDCELGRLRFPRTV